MARFPAAEVLFVGTERLVDARALQDRKFSTATLSSGALKGKSLAGGLRTLLQMPMSIGRAGRIIHDFKPDLVFGVGGYVTGPVVLAAKIFGIATCIHEQNSIPGMANRILGKVVSRVFVSIPGSETFFPAGKSVLTGNPVRRELLEKGGSEKKKKLTLLILGGSQGAHMVNTLAAGGLAAIKGLPANFQVIHQTGFQDEEKIRQIYEQSGIQARVAAFFDDMATVYREADLVVSRAGATTLAELSVLKIPALLIPYPHAADDHQTQNGRYLVEAGAAKMFHEKGLKKEALGEEILKLLLEPETRHAMAAKMAQVAFPQATEKIIDSCLALMKNRGWQQIASDPNGLQVW